MSEDLKRLRAQQEANSAAIARMQMMMQAQNARQVPDDDEPLDAPLQQQQQAPQQQQQYQQADPNQLVLQAITAQAARAAAMQVRQDLTATSDVETKIKNRMTRLVADYPALTQDDSELVLKSREVYARIAHENPALDEATRYELAVREAASVVGARPINAPIEDYAKADFVMPVGRNPAMGNGKSSKSRLTPNIIANAKLMGINVDPGNAEGKKNLSELSEYSQRFNADQDETQYRYK